MVGRLAIRMLLLLLVGAIVSLLPLHRDAVIPVSFDCPAPRSEMCRLKWESCPALHGASTGRRASAPACAAEYAARCLGPCGEPLRVQGWAERLRRLGPWWLPSIPGGVAWWQGLQG